MVPSSFEVTKKRTPEATESRHKFATASSGRSVGLLPSNLKLTRGRRSDDPINCPEVGLSILICTHPREAGLLHMWLCVAQLPNSPLSGRNVPQGSKEKSIEGCSATRSL